MHQQIELKKSSKLWIILLLIAVFIFDGILAFLIFSKKETIPETKKPETPILEEPIKSAGPIDCGTDLDCLITASQNCNPAKVTYDMTTTTDVQPDILTTTITFYEIKGVEENKCLLYLRIEKQDIDFSEKRIQKELAEGKTQEQIQQDKQEINELFNKIGRGKDGTCWFNNNADLTSFLNNWKKYDLLGGGVFCDIGTEKFECTSIDGAVAECDGEVFILLLRTIFEALP